MSALVRRVVGQQREEEVEVAVVPQRASLDKVLQEIVVDRLPKGGTDTSRDVVRVLVAVAGRRRRDIRRGRLRDGRWIRSGDADPLGRLLSLVRRHELAYDGGLARAGRGSLLVPLLVPRKAGVLLLGLIDNSQGVQVPIAWAFPAPLATLPALGPGCVALCVGMKPSTCLQISGAGWALKLAGHALVTDEQTNRQTDRETDGKKTSPHRCREKKDKDMGVAHLDASCPTSKAPRRGLARVDHRRDSSPVARVGRLGAERL